MPSPLLPRRARVLLVGAGRVGTAVASLLGRAHHEIVAVASRSASSAADAAALLDAPPLALEDLGLAPAAADVVLVGARDDAIGPVVESVVAAGLRPSLVCHFAGSLGLAPLGALVAHGTLGAALHPVQACPDVATAVARLPGSAWGVTCSPAAAEWVDMVVREDLSGHPVVVAERDRSIWHAASVTTSNGIAALLSLGESLLRSVGVDRPEAVLGPLAAGTVANALEGGGGGATLTGPVVRGEVDTVAAHLAALRRDSPALVPAYISVTKLIAREAVAAGRLDETAGERIVRLFRP